MFFVHKPLLPIANLSPCLITSYRCHRVAFILVREKKRHEAKGKGVVDRQRCIGDKSKSKGDVKIDKTEEETKKQAQELRYRPSGLGNNLHLDWQQASPLFFSFPFLSKHHPL